MKNSPVGDRSYEILFTAPSGERCRTDATQHGNGFSRPGVPLACKRFEVDIDYAYQASFRVERNGVGAKFILSIILKDATWISKHA